MKLSRNLIFYKKISLNLGTGYKFMPLDWTINRFMIETFKYEKILLTSFNLRKISCALQWPCFQTEARRSKKSFLLKVKCAFYFRFRVSYSASARLPVGISWPRPLEPQKCCHGPGWSSKKSEVFILSCNMQKFHSVWQRPIK